MRLAPWRLTAAYIAALSAAIVWPDVSKADVAQTQSARIVDRSSPETLIRSATGQIQKELRAEPLGTSDSRRIIDIVDRDVLPYTDIRATTRLAMGRYWHQCTAAQQDEIIKLFQALLIRTYSGALGLLSPDQAFRFPTSRFPVPANESVIRTVAMYNGRAVEIDYRLYRSADGWRVYDMNLLGVWLIQIYRDQFSEVILKSGISGLITHLHADSGAPAVMARTPAAMPSSN